MSFKENYENKVSSDKMIRLSDVKTSLKERIKELRDMGSFLDNENGLFVRIEDIDDFEKQILKELEK